MSKGGGSGTNTVVQNSAPPQSVLNAYNQVTGQATNVAAQPLSQYTGPLVAGFTPDQLSAFGTIDQSQGVANPYINAAASLMGSAATPITPTAFSPNAVQQYMSPYTQDVVNATQAQFNNQNQQQQQGVISNAISAGAFGGDRSAIAQAETANQQQLAQAPVIAGLENQAYTQGLGEFNTQQQVGVGAQEASGWLGQNAGYGIAGLGNEAQNTALTGASAQLQSGALQQQLGQENLNVPYEQFLQQQAYPFQTTSWLAGIDTGLGSGQGGTSSTTSPDASLLGQIGGLGLTGLGAYGLANEAGLFGTAAGVSGIAGSSVGIGAGDAAYAALAAHGGRIVPRRKYDTGGNIPGFGMPASSLTDPSVPDLSISFVPAASSMQGRGVGIPGAPKPYSSGDPVQQGMQSASMASAIGKLISGNGALNGARRGGRIRFAPGGMVIGYTPVPGRAGANIPILSTATAAPETAAQAAPATNYSFNPSNLPSVTLPSTAAPSIGAGASAPTIAPSVAPNPAPVSDNQQAIDTAGGGEFRGGRISRRGALGGAVAPTDAMAGFQAGGDVAAGEAAAGIPGATGTNPLLAGLYQQYASLPAERLQELAVAVPPTSPQGQIIQRVLQVKRMGAGSSATPSLGAPPSPTAFAPTAPTGPQGQQMRRGGRAGFDDGGDVSSEGAISPDQMPDVRGVLSSAGSWIGDGIHNIEPVADWENPTPDTLGAFPKSYAGAFSPPTGAPALETPPTLAAGIPATAFKPSGGGAPNAGASKGIAHVPSSLGPPTQNDIAATPPPTSGAGAEMAPPPPQSTSSKIASSPWLALAAMGLGTMASRSPHPLQAIGEGGLAAVKELGEQQSAEQKADQLAELGDYHRADIANRTKALANQEAYQTNELDVRRQEAQNEADWRHTMAQKGTWMYGQGTDPNDPTKQVGGSWYMPGLGGEPKFLPGVGAPKSPGAQSMMARQQAAAELFPNDPASQRAYIANPSSVGSPQQWNQRATAQAQRELGPQPASGQSPDDYRVAIDKRAGELMQRWGIGAAPAPQSGAPGTARAGAPPASGLLPPMNQRVAGQTKTTIGGTTYVWNGKGWSPSGQP